MSVTHNSLAALFDDTADAIRETFGAYGTIKADDFPSIIRRKGVPLAFQRCEYIKGHGSEYLDLGNYSASLVEYSFDFMPTNTGGGAWADYLSFPDNCNVPRLERSYDSCAWYSFDAGGRNNILAFNLRATISLVNNSLFVDRTRIDSFAGDRTINNGTVSILKRSSGSVITSGIVYSLQLYLDGEIALNLFPYYLKTDWNGIPAGTIGLYDLCGSLSSNGTPFYTNAGTGAFTKGADVL